MKILHVETGRHLYGGSLQVRYLIEGLANEGVHNILVCEQSAPLAEAVSAWADSIHPVTIKGDLDVAFIRRLKTIIKQEQADLVHLHSRRGCDTLGGIAARMAGVPVVLSRRVDNPEPRLVAAIKYRLYDQVVTISQAIRCVLASEGIPLKKLACVPSAVDCDQYVPGADRPWFHQEFDLTDQDIVIGVVAQLIVRKGHRYLLDALPQLFRKHPHLKVLFFGRGPLQENLQEQINAAGWQERVRLVGFRDDLERVMSNLDLLVHPAEMEGLGVSLLQAAASGVPIVASAVGGIPEIVRHGMTGLLVAPADVGALESAIDQLLNQPQKAGKMAAAARQLVEVAFSVPAMVQGNLAVYQQLLARER
ncbi:MAG: glycosyltransferase family 4 protein [Pseudomonadota bacterium]